MDYFVVGIGTIECNTQSEIDHYWAQLGKVGNYNKCGWLTDKYGISWQIVPAILGERMADKEKRQKVIQAFMQMTKFDIEIVKNASYKNLYCVAARAIRILLHVIFTLNCFRDRPTSILIFLGCWPEKAQQWVDSCFSCRNSIRLFSIRINTELDSSLKKIPVDNGYFF